MFAIEACIGLLGGLFFFATGVIRSTILKYDIHEIDEPYLSLYTHDNPAITSAISFLIMAIFFYDFAYLASLNWKWNILEHIRTSCTLELLHILRESRTPGDEEALLHLVSVINGICTGHQQNAPSYRDKLKEFANREEDPFCDFIKIPLPDCKLKPMIKRDDLPDWQSKPSQPIYLGLAETRDGDWSYSGILEENFQTSISIQLNS